MQRHVYMTAVTSETSELLQMAVGYRFDELLFGLVSKYIIGFFLVYSQI